MPHQADYWIDTLNLEPHPEGGHYAEIYRASESIALPCLPKRYDGDRDMATSIYFLLQAHEISHFHRLLSDELWHFHTGQPLLLHVIEPAGHYHKITLGSDPDAGQTFFSVIRKGAWFGATVLQKRQFSLASCTVTPGFDFQDFEMAQQANLLKRYPQHSDIIQRLTKG